MSDRDERVNEIAQRQRTLRDLCDRNQPAPVELITRIYYDINWLLDQSDRLERVRLEVSR